MASLAKINLKDHFDYKNPNSRQKQAVCKWCKYTIAANATREKAHLQDRCAAYDAAHGKKKQLTVADGFFKAPATRLSSRDIQKKFAKACFVGGRPFSIFEGEEMAAAFRALDSTFVPPNRQRVASFLDEVYEDTLKEVKAYVHTAKHLNLVFDGSDDVAFNRVINLSVEIPGQAAFYWETIDTKATAHSSLDQIDLLLPSINAAVDGDLSKVNAVCTDTNTTQRKCQVDLQATPGLSHILGVLCDSHSLQLLVKDIVTTSPWRSTLEKAVYVITYFRHSKKQYARLREMMLVTGNGKVYSLLVAAITRWGSQQGALQSLIRVKEALLMFGTNPMVQAEAGIQNPLYGYPEATNPPESTNPLRKVLLILNDPSFWRATDCLLAILQPITAAQKQSETERAYVHRVIPRWRSIQGHWRQLESSHKWHEVDWVTLHKQFATRFAKQTTEVHWAAYSFDPESFAPGALNSDQKECALQWVTKHAPRELQSAIVNEYTQFRLGKGPRFGPGSDFATGSRPIEEKWDTLAAIESPLAIHIVTRLFNALANSVPSERSFSASNFIHTKARNRLKQSNVNKLAFIYMNTRVLERLRLAAATLGITSSPSPPSHRLAMVDLEERFLEGDENAGDHWKDLSGHFGLTMHSDGLADPRPRLPGHEGLSSSTQLSVGRDNWSQNTLVWGGSVSSQGRAGLAHQSAAQGHPFSYPRGPWDSQ